MTLAVPVRLHPLPRLSPSVGEGWGCGVEGEGGDGGGWRPIEAPTSIKANWRMRVAMLFIGKKYRVEGAWTKNVVEHVK